MATTESFIGRYWRQFTSMGIFLSLFAVMFTGGGFVNGASPAQASLPDDSSSIIPKVQKDDQEKGTSDSKDDSSYSDSHRTAMNPPAEEERRYNNTKGKNSVKPTVPAAPTAPIAPVRPADPIKPPASPSPDGESKGVIDETLKVAGDTIDKVVSDSGDVIIELNEGLKTVTEPVSKTLGGLLGQSIRSLFSFK